jgi:cytochrome c oxidase cbb3-type subunit 3
VIFILLYLLKNILPKKAKLAKVVVGVEQKAEAKIHWWNKINRFKPIEQEADLDLNHDYDGIRELDNRLPPWWIYGFYVTIIFAAVYLWRYHVSHTAPSSEQEYQLAMKEAEEQKARYLKNSANNVDENTVKLLTQASDLDAGKKVFEQNCTPCHGKAAEGNTVGPNLTDDYWLHGGSLSDVFKSVKYGWPDKGMRSWKDDFSPLQIAQITSYLKSLHGTNPPNAKEPQGDLYKEAGADSTSTQVAAQ